MINFIGLKWLSLNKTKKNLFIVLYLSINQNLDFISIIATYDWLLLAFSSLPPMVALYVIRYKIVSLIC